MVLLIPLLGGLIAGAARRLLPGALRKAGQVAGGLLGSGARRSVKTAVLTGTSAAVTGAAAGKITRVLGAAGAAAAGGAVMNQVLPGGAVTVGGVNLNPWANTGRKKYRRINPTNPKALKRAMRRLEGFGEFAKAMGYSRPPKCIGGFKGLPKRKRATKCR